MKKLNHYWEKYNEEFKTYLNKEVEEGRLSRTWSKSLISALIKFFKENQVNEALDVLSIPKITNPQVKALKKFIKFLTNFKYKEVDTRELEAINRQLKVKQSPKLEGKPANEEVMKSILLSALAKGKDYRYYLYKTLIYTGLRLSHAFKLLQEIGKGK